MEQKEESFNTMEETGQVDSSHNSFLKQNYDI